MGPFGQLLAWVRRIPPPYFSSTLITLILVIGEVSHDIVGGYERFAAALGVALLTEAVLSKSLRGKWPFLLSAYISGNSVIILLKPTAGVLWPFVIAAFVSIASKYVLTFKGRHVWNPTNFGLCALLLLAPGSISILSHQWSNSFWAVAVIYAVGLLVVSRAKVLHVSLTYLVVFATLALLRSGGTLDGFRQEINPLTGAMYSLFVFFMITDPKTLVTGRGLQVLVTVLIGVVDAGIRMLGDADVAWAAPLLYAPPLFALFFVGPVAVILQRLTETGVDADRVAPPPGSLEETPPARPETAGVASSATTSGPPSS